MFSGQFYEKWMSVRERNIKLLLEGVTYIAAIETATCIITIKIAMRIMHCRKYHLHDCNRDCHLHNFNKNCPPHICCRKLYLYKCISVAETSNCITATETVTFVTAKKKKKRSTNISVAVPLT